ncbi:MAG: hypothetical protein AABZ47_18115 [Planctomycetota bacterium]
MTFSTFFRRFGWTQRTLLLGALVISTLASPPARAFDEGTECTSSEDCEDGLYCNGSENCVNGYCEDAVDPCVTGQTCNEESDLCVGGAPNPGVTLHTHFGGESPCGFTEATLLYDNG